MTTKKQLVAWLKDAHEMEQGIARTLKAHAKQAREHPSIRKMIEEHLEETENHVEEVAGCLGELGEEVGKAGFAKGLFAGLPENSDGDTIVKNAISEMATEHFEIACYSALIAAATELDEPTIAEVCENILEEEEAMADLLAAELPEITALYLAGLQKD